MVWHRSEQRSAGGWWCRSDATPDGLSVAGGSVVMEGSDGIVGGAASVDVTGSESVRVGSTGSLIELTGTGKIQYRQFVWRSSAAFDEFENAVPLISDVEEVIIRSRLQGGALTAGDGETYVYMDLLGSDAGAGGRVCGVLPLAWARSLWTGCTSVRAGRGCCSWFFTHNNPSFVGWVMFSTSGLL